MASTCDILSIAAKKACSGKCGGGMGCSTASHIVVVAACGGMIARFRKGADGQVLPVEEDAQAVFPSVEAFQQALALSATAHKIDQLVIVGSANDIAWVQRLIPADMVRYVTAEIEYPLVTGWFGEQPQLRSLSRALEQLLKG